MEAARVLVVDDDSAQADIMAALIGQEGYDAVAVNSGHAALDRLDKDVVDLVITDLMMPAMDGIMLLQHIRKAHPLLPVILLSAHGTIPAAVRSIKLGAHDFVEKPVEREALLLQVQKALAMGLRPPLEDLDAPDAFFQVEKMANRIALSPEAVLIRGETGTGKTRLAQYIHDHSPRRHGPFVLFDCSAIPGNMIESELFGHVKGAFTGATHPRDGAARTADGGTLFLDEIGDLELPLQTRLLRLIQAREVRPVGADHPVRVDLRIISATKQNLEAMVAAKTFRDDLYFRINVVDVVLPPLRDRPGAVRSIAQDLALKISSDHMSRRIEFEPAALDALEAHDWPGNIRELENRVRRILIFADGDRISAAEVHDQLRTASVASPRTSSSAAPDGQSFANPGPDDLDLPASVRRTELAVITQALKRSQGNRSAAARLLNISRRTLYNKLKELSIEDRHRS